MTALSFLSTSFHLAAPLIYCALGGYFSERSGIVNIALEGMLLGGAFSAGAVASLTGNPWLGLFAGILGGATFGALHALLCVRFRSDQIVSGLAVNALAMGLTPVLSQALFGMSGGTPQLEDAMRIPKAIEGVSLLAALSIAAAFASEIAHRYTVFGQHLRFAGEHPGALSSQGVSVARTRWTALLLCGALCGIGGAYLSIDHGTSFARNMSAGRGFIALAALTLSRRRPLQAACVAFVFGGLEALQILFTGVSLSNGTPIPAQALQALPYALTMVATAVYFGRLLHREKH